MNKNRIRLTESQLRRVIKESVKRVLNEQSAYDYYRNLSPQKQEELDSMWKYERGRGNNISFVDFMCNYFGMDFDGGTSNQKSGGSSGTYGQGTNTRDDLCSRW